MDQKNLLELSLSCSGTIHGGRKVIWRGQREDILANVANDNRAAVWQCFEDCKATGRQSHILAMMEGCEVPMHLVFTWLPRAHSVRFTCYRA